jgi:hypothetical protein
LLGQGVWSATSAAFPATVAFPAIIFDSNIGGVNRRHFYQFQA